MNSIFENMVRIGIVSDIDASSCKVRVIFRELDMTSGWLYVLQHPATLALEKAGSHRHTVSDTYTGGGSSDYGGEHCHNGNLNPWMPKINQSVLVLYLPMFNSDGFVLGVIP